MNLMTGDRCECVGCCLNSCVGVLGWEEEEEVRLGE